MNSFRRKWRREWHGFGGWRRFRDEWLLDHERSGVGWEPRDLWFGLYWDWPNAVRFNLFICPIPTVVIQLSWKWTGK